MPAHKPVMSRTLFSPAAFIPSVYVFASQAADVAPMIRSRCPVCSDANAGAIVGPACGARVLAPAGPIVSRALLSSPCSRKLLLLPFLPLLFAVCSGITIVVAASHKKRWHDAHHLLCLSGGECDTPVNPSQLNLSTAPNHAPLPSCLLLYVRVCVCNQENRRLSGPLFFPCFLLLR